MQDKFTQKTLDMSQQKEMQPKSIPRTYHTLTSYVQDFPVNLFQSLEDVGGSVIQEVRYVLRSYGLLNKGNHLFFYSKMSKACYLTTKGKPLESSQNRLMNWGTMSNGNCLTASISFHRTGRGYSLSDILEDQVAEKYYLSEKSVQGMLNHSERHKTLKTDIVELYQNHGCKFGK